MNGEERNAYRIFVGKPEEKRPLGRPRRGWVDDIKMGETMRWYGLDRSASGKGPVESSCEQGKVFIKCWEVLE
jgi:hypothetical protein